MSVINFGENTNFDEERSMTGRGSFRGVRGTLNYESLLLYRPLRLSFQRARAPSRVLAQSSSIMVVKISREELLYFRRKLCPRQAQAPYFEKLNVFDVLYSLPLCAEHFVKRVLCGFLRLSIIIEKLAVSVCFGA